jgi:pyruvate formate lyase activating enzyme
MRIAGLQEASLIDYPGKICCIVFTQGCNFRCPYCHNPDLVEPSRYGELMSEEDFFDFLKRREGKLDAVSVTGGEPTMQPDLADFLKRVKKRGFAVKLDSNGTDPATLKRLLEQSLVDYMAMDVKAPLEDYERVVRMPVDAKKLRESINTIKTLSPDYEFRTTWARELLKPEDIVKIAKEIRGAKGYFLQNFVPSKTLDPEAENYTTFSEKDFEKIKSELEALVEKLGVR